MRDYITQNPVFSVMTAISLVISLRVFLGLYILPKHRKIPLLRLIVWSLLIWFPFFGPLLYFCLYRVPSDRAGGINGQVSSSAVGGAFLP